MRRQATVKLGAYGGLAALGLIASLVLGLPELVVLAAPFALVAGAGLALAEQPDPVLSIDLERERAVEGDDVSVTIRISSATAVEQLDVLLELRPGIAIVDGRNPIAVRLGPGTEREVELVLRCERWGAYLIGRISLRAHDRLRVFRYESRVDVAVPLKVYPRPEYVEELLRPLETQVFAGNYVAREKGEGIEFADLRAFLAGDPLKRINWRASARRGELWVNEFHAERNADVVLFLDSFTEARHDDASTLDRSVRAAAALADRYLQDKNRVGVISFGAVLNWLRPATGVRQVYRIVDSLLDTEITLNYAWKDIDVIPRGTLPPKALVVALTPLLDERACGALLDLRRRGFDLAVVEISPLPFTSPGTDEHEQLAYRIWQLKREALRGEYERHGIPVAVWDDDRPLVAAIEGVRTFRRHASLGRA